MRRTLGGGEGRTVVVGRDDHCQSVDVPLCGVWGARSAQCDRSYLYVSWWNDRTWVDWGLPDMGPIQL